MSSALRQIRAVADEQQPGRDPRRDPREHFHDGRRTRFTGRKFDMWMTSFSQPRRTIPRAQRRLGRRWYTSQSRKFGMTVIGLRTASVAVRILARRLSDTAVTPSDSLDRERHRLRVRLIAADERDVGAVQRRDDPRHAGRIAGRRQDLLGEVRRRRVRHRVVRMDDVEPDSRATCTIRRREREHVLRLAEQRIRRRVDPVKRQPRLILPSRNGVSVLSTCTSWPRAASDLASSVATMPLPADRGVADDADVHRRLRGGGG